MTEQERYMTTTPFQTIYSRFLSKITDDMYISWTEADTYKDLKNMLLSAIPQFKSPKFKLFDYDSDKDVVDESGLVLSQGLFNFGLTDEEINVFAQLMLVEWIARQIATVDITRMKYGSSDFRMSSQANHLDKLLKMKDSFYATAIALQKTYVRRKVDEDGYIRPNFSGLGGSK